MLFLGFLTSELIRNVKNRAISCQESVFYDKQITIPRYRIFPYLSSIMAYYNYERLYYDFTKEMQRIETEMNQTNYTFKKDCEEMQRQMIRMREVLEVRNRDMQLKLSELRQMIEMLCTITPKV